jgi:NADPH:quinone reductase-like Zn-dependent oxidoreductase
MRAFAIRSLGEAPTLTDLRTPSARDALLIRVSCAGINPWDYKAAEMLSEDSTFPFVLGVDFAGVVERVPPGQHEFHAGDRVFGMARTHGSYAEYTAVAPGQKTEPVAAIPDGLSDEQAAALPIPALTALQSLELLAVGEDTNLVVIGGAGVVGGYAVQMARARGARVIATVRGDADEAQRLGAEEVYDSESSDVNEALRASHPDGVDAVLDLVNGPDAIRGDADFLKPGGRIVSTIYAADEHWFAERHIAARNFASNANPLSSPAGLREVASMLADGTITARIGPTASLDEAPLMYQRLRSGEIRGKALIRL